MRRKLAGLCFNSRPRTSDLGLKAGVVASPPSHVIRFPTNLGRQNYAVSGRLKISSHKFKNCLINAHELSSIALAIFCFPRFPPDRFPSAHAETHSYIAVA